MKIAYGVTPTLALDCTSRAQALPGRAFTRALEAGYEAAFERLLKGKPPADIAVGKLRR